MYFGCDLNVEQWVKDFELLGYKHDEAIELVNFAMQPIEIDDKIIDEFNNIGCTSFLLTPEEIERILNNEST